MAKITLSHTIVGRPEEVEKYGGQIPESMKKDKKKISAGELESFKGKITAGTEMDVDDKRAQELKDAGVVEGFEKKVIPQANILANAEINKTGTDKTTAKPAPKEKAETKKAIPTQKKQK